MRIDKQEKRLGQKKNLALATFLVAFMTATAFFIAFIINGDGYFLFFGDFNVQQIPFYQECHNAVRSGELFWNWNTDLGANFIGSYSFYLLGSPFFWLTLPFPNNFVPYLLGPLLILKFSFAALTAYLFIRRFTARPQTAMVGGLLYAFSGFSVYNIFFNHFHEAIVFFPLLLLALELFLSERRRGLLICAVFICCLSNYYFFFGMVVFTIIYWLVRVVSGSFKFSIKEFLLMLLECIIGVALTGALMLPTVLEVIQNSRVTDMLSGWKTVTYHNGQLFYNIIECFFFPPDLPARPVFFPDASYKWSSLGGWLPLFSMVGTATWLLSQKKGTWLRRLLFILIIFALFPGLNSIFSLFNVTFYARWFYMPILMMCLATSLAIEDTEVDWDSAWRWVFGITLTITAVIGLMPTLEKGKIAKIGLYTDASVVYNIINRIGVKLGLAVHNGSKSIGNVYDLRFWITCALAIAGLLALKALIPAIKQKRTAVFKPIIALICVFSVAYSAFFIASGQSHSYDMNEVMIEDLIEGDVNLDLNADGFARIDVYEGVDNTGLYLNLPSINFFHSIVPAGITDFYEFCGVTRTVGSRPDTKQPAIRSLLSVKYLLDPEINSSKTFGDQNGGKEMPGYIYYGEQNDYKIYKNENYIPMGFAYQYYMNEEFAKAPGKNNAAQMMLKALLVEEDDIEYIKPYLKNLADDYSYNSPDDGKENLVFTNLKYKEECATLRGDKITAFGYSSRGFTAKTNYESSRVVFFSVPFSDGWTATVNGAPARIVKANKGFMAVVVPSGECEVNFVYETPGLYTGIVLTICAACLMLIYLIIVALWNHFKGAPPPDYPEGQVIATRAMLYEAANTEADDPSDDGLLDDIDHDSINAYSGFSGGFKFNDSALNNIEDNQLPENSSFDISDFSGIFEDDE